MAYGFAGCVRPEAYSELAADQARLGARMGGAGGRRPIGRIVAGGVFAAAAGAIEVAQGSLALLFDGRIGRRDALIDRLGANASPSASSDGELLLAAWRAWRTDVCEHLPGEWALAVWDGEARRLHLMRDPSHNRALYYCAAPGLTAFATDLGSVLSWPDIPREIDEDGLADVLSVNPEAGGRTVWRGVRLAPSGGRVILSDAGERTERWWDPARVAPVRFRRDEDYVEAARDLLDQAILDRAPTRGPIAVETSGGLDSTAVLDGLDRLGLSARTHALSLVGPDGGERPALEALAGAYTSMSFEQLSASSGALAGAAGRAGFAAAPTPVGNWGVMRLLGPLARRAAALGADQILTGDMGDAAFSCDGLGLLPQLLRRGRWLRAARECVALDRETDRSGWSYARTAIRQSLGLSRNLAAGDWLAYVGVRPEFAARTDLAGRLRANGFPGGDQLERSPAALVNWVVPRNRLATEHSAMIRAATGVTRVDPMSDRRLLEFCCAVPLDQFLRQGRTRWLARRVLGAGCPAVVRDAPVKLPQQRDWFADLADQRDALREEVAALGRSALASRVLDVEHLAGLIENWPSDGRMDPARRRRYQGLLRRAIHVGSWLRWVEGSNDPGPVDRP